MIGPDNDEYLTHRDLFRDNVPMIRCWKSGKLMLSSRLAHRAVRLMRTRGAPEIHHYRCDACLARHLTSMPRGRWPEQWVPNSPPRYVEPCDGVA